MKRILVVTFLSLSCTACAVKSPLPTGQAAYDVIPSIEAAPTIGNYLIGPLDTVNITVFQEPDLSVEGVQVDPAGRLPLPLLGSVNASGKTADILASDIRQRLATYLVNPNVSVTVNSITQRVIVEGSVKQPGVYDIRGNSSLLEALAMAQSPTNVADLDQVFIFRQVNGQTQGARFDLQRIRAGVDADPAIIAGDRVVVGLNQLAAAWQDYFSAPIFNVFRLF